MKVFLIYLVLIVNSLNVRGSDATPDIQIFQQLQLCMQGDIFDRKKELPTSFEELTSLRRILKENSRMIQHLNNFTIVPGAPIINPSQELSLNLVGNRIFATCRTSNLQPSRIGRIVLLATSNGSSVFPYWIPEPQFQIILKQLKGFDPAKQALAFQDLAQGGAEEVPRQKSSNFNENSVKGERHTLPPDQSSMKGAAKEPSDSQPLWIVGGIIFLISVMGYVIRQWRCKWPQ